MQWKLRPRESCAYDVLALGEVMLRLDPLGDNIRATRDFRVWEGGGEYNVARGLAKCFGLRSGALTAFADNEVGALLEDLICQGGVDTALIKYLPYDGIGRRCRNGLNFTERGYGVRGSMGCSDRANTAISLMGPDDFDFEYIFGTLGVRWLHTGGVYAGLSPQATETLLRAVEVAKKHGTMVSYDLNYRPSQWKDMGGATRALEVNERVAAQIDVLIGCLGIDFEHGTPTNEDYWTQMEVLKERYPNLQCITTTTRRVITASVNDWGAIAYANGGRYAGKTYEGLEILDRVGGGDSFASGLIYGLLEELPLAEALDYGLAHGACAMSTPGDTSMMSLRKIKDLVRAKANNQAVNSLQYF